MRRSVQRTLSLAAAMTVIGTWAMARAEGPSPPNGFRAVFNGRDLTGWHGLNPHLVATLTGEKKEAKLAEGFDRGMM